ncbi:MULTISPECIES: DNA adenine methylase [Archaeoglobus]|uniref:site-specific DNA-methyltransferase (adenine-specific) n=1 Tax=Archaeoglobus fulgidus TaxID=2234 RepID=A0A101E2B7_ARCFL|nr:MULTISPECIES: DNA adenine methylase [Archaeoglobus]KUJ94434.1 MAG: DNA adenine methylase Dam [Archaeoglobus fulgidus]KUK07372.1 MAG: DNA adenine methylase Dam [Archaeoglobus fulgidus]MDI3496659.1 adenine methylase [Archaeoglobus sp.]
MLKPLVKWAGGKRQLLPELIKRVPSNWDTYYEPFVGGGALLIELYNQRRLKSAVISDLNEELINLYKVVKNNPAELIEALNNPHFKNEKETYLKLRKRFNEIIGNPEYSVERASLFLYLNKHCYNGLWRVNKKGKFNVPFGRYTNPSMPSEELILEFSKMLKNVEILNYDFEEAVKSSREGDFVYFDPPYQPVSDTAYFTDYTSQGFDYSEQKRLAKVCKKLSKRGVYVMVSNSNTDEIKELYDDFYIFVVNANRFINSKADRRKGATEVIITNYEIKGGEERMCTLDTFI